MKPNAAAGLAPRSHGGAVVCLQYAESGPRYGKDTGTSRARDGIVLLTAGWCAAAVRLSEPWAVSVHVWRLASGSGAWRDETARQLTTTSQSLERVSPCAPGVLERMALGQVVNHVLRLPTPRRLRATSRAGAAVRMGSHAETVGKRWRAPGMGVGVGVGVSSYP
ncbi:hypothetical protein P171DRAFT_121375 [Karstenula rhodostoma CBS 690.94]|uniref:Uncharacterized protein n=1 Tax=Karstenula rhodostoma CBS 690.94 TaxID=1392251 RepID=A0A9P4P8F0_9PLEO|nr:hypothetical protein P171DRAFT_121375 [Karstenula rhodostoma CBS 690.94]